MYGAADRRSYGVALEGRLGQAYNEEAFRYFLEIERKRAARARRPVRLLLLRPGLKVCRAAMQTETSSIGRVDSMSIGAIPVSDPSGPRRKPTPGRREPHRPLIISEELFRGVLIKERKRVDRLNQPLVLLIIAVKDRQGGDSPSIWVPVIEALAAITRETDVLGWFEWRGAIGVILPEIRTTDAAKASELEARVCQELIK